MEQRPNDLNNIIASIRDKEELQRLIDNIKKAAPELVQGISMQLSVALANILAGEHIAELEREQSMMLSISNDIATTRDKKDLLDVLRYFPFPIR
jgi:hypothetical protein